MLETEILEYMIAIAEEKSLTKAADRLLVSQPALSRQVKKLEKELDARLFYREKNEMLLTDAGKVYINGARSALNIYGNAINELRRLSVSGRKEITLVYNNALLPGFHTDILPSFCELHRDIAISTINGNVSIAKDYLTNGIADLAVMAAAEDSHSILEYIPLRDEELLLAVPNVHPCVKPFQESGVDLRRLRDEYFILNQINSYFRMLETNIFNSCQFTPKVLCEISDLDASRHMVCNGKGAAFLPRSMTKNADGYVCFPLSPPAVFHIVIAYHKSIVLTKPMKDLITLLLKSCG